ncbi:MAG: YigZ family protein [Lachnospiraceae bacterium]|nr:YigZ family protein [Lachnospiraceae bacterium]
MGEKRQEFPSYKVVYEQGTGEYEEKKSRFIANVMPVESEEEAAAFIESIKKKYYDARHNCPAFIIGRNRELTRCSDDGEPSGTAGKPILEVLMGAGVTNVAVVVTRYFGGTLLGTGGLVRAYTQATQAGLADAKIATMRYGTELLVGVDYTDVGKVQYLLANEQIEIVDSRYAQSVDFEIRIPHERVEEMQKKLTEITCGRAVMEITGAGYYMDKKND